jgi:hypothetical protein
VVNALLDAHDALPNPTATSREVMNRVRGGQLEVLFDDGMPPVGGLATGRVLPGAAATVEQRFFTELHAYTAEYELAHGNQLSHLLGPELRGARHLDDISAGVLTVESYLVPGLARQPGLEHNIVQRVGGMFPSLPRRAP